MLADQWLKKELPIYFGIYFAINWATQLNVLLIYYVLFIYFNNLNNAKLFKICFAFQLRFLS